MPFEITVTRTFSAAHQLRLADGSVEPWHEHDWVVAVTVSAQQLDAIGVVMDFHELEGQVDRIINSMRNRTLNELDAFARRNPSAEHVARYIADAIRLPESVSLDSVQVTEAPGCVATYRPG
jgi:6-pyruvoyltetrahydropterin/6-carboxytetrahydropterin synthase